MPSLSLVVIPRNPTWWLSVFTTTYHSVSTLLLFSFNLFRALFLWPKGSRSAEIVMQRIQSRYLRVFVNYGFFHRVCTIAANFCRFVVLRWNAESFIANKKTLPSSFCITKYALTFHSSQIISLIGILYYYLLFITSNTSIYNTYTRN